MPSDIIVSTGNVLSLNKKPGRKSAEELTEAMKTLDLTKTLTQKLISRSPDDLHEKLRENDRSEISIGAKIFLNTNGKPSKVSTNEFLKEAVNSLVETLGVEYVDGVVLAYHSNLKGIDELAVLWKNLEDHYDLKTISQLGISDADTETIEDLCKTARVPPVIVQINLSSCCVVPPGECWNCLLTCFGG